MKTANADGTPMVCKFCKKSIALDVITKRIYELDQKTFHIDNCPRRKAHFKREGVERQESGRKARFDGLDSAEAARAAMLRRMERRGR